jgi:uncharacterized protein
MVELEDIQKLTERIARAYRPERIILFGSYAYGSPGEESDVDLLVVLPFQGKGSRKAAEILTQVRPSFPVDIIVRTPAQVQQRIAQNDFFMREIVEKGRVLFASSNG